MFGFISRRIAMALVVMFVVALISFLLFRFVGDPVNQMVGVETTPEQREALRQRLGLNDPVFTQFFRYVLGAIQFDFGNSYQFKQPVADLIGRRLPATLELSFASAIFALLLGIPMGVYTGLNRDSWLSKMFLSVSLVGISLPTFFIGILFIFFFSVTLQWLPSFGRGEVVQIAPFWDTGFLTISGLKALILPAVTLGLYQMTLIMRLIRAEMLEVMRTDHIKFARARGLPNRSVYYIHALKNTMVPVITITGLQLGSIIAFAVITETVFQWPGMGILFLQAVQNVDIPIMAAYLLLTAFIFVVINLTVDILYIVIDPRLRTERSRA
ncbi:Glutathione transport system permease protein GsiC [Pseudovibrio axinellae]|uniref:Glutathione transport system permease protein GsiC n=1 Tax=Pseudovibrio axinellae TaxID=989403 RepID=A0A166A830_9HYPH|nr:ABC transporter permease [Pseudovibrio axinellae]KZL20712.1 Glutathione transport system permease protein GsiC [Pseudovibrio axinellae]SER24981.1 peptide/nickel transport system permease protein [Pseudovibrio axinellae]